LLAGRAAATEATVSPARGVSTRGRHRLSDQAVLDLSAKHRRSRVVQPFAGDRGGRHEVDSAVEAVLAEYHARAEVEREEMAARPPEEIRRRIDEFLIYIGPTVGRFLHDLAVAAGARRILEIGTSYGYSTV